MFLADNSPTAYDAVADEYYDVRLHPTCANFREASDGIINAWLSNYYMSNAAVLEVGAGASSAAVWLQRNGIALDQLIISDASEQMLNYSKQWAALGARLEVAAAARLPFAGSTIDIVIAALGDPYNTAEFWFESCRVLKKNGLIMFTTPSYEWAAKFRANTASGQRAVAEFDVQGGRHIEVPSFIFPRDVQNELIQRAGLMVNGISESSLAMIQTAVISDKLNVLTRAEATVVTGFLVGKRESNN